MVRQRNSLLSGRSCKRCRAKHDTEDVRGIARIAAANCHRVAKEYIAMCMDPGWRGTQPIELRAQVDTEPLQRLDAAAQTADWHR